MKYNFFEHLFEQSLIHLPIGIFEKLKFLEYFYFEELRRQLVESLKTKNPGQFTETLRKIIKLQTKKELDESAKTEEILASLLKMLIDNDIDEQIMFIKGEAPDPKKTAKTVEQDGWSYPGRIGAQYINTIAERYHWPLRDIENLNVNVGLFLIQEIMVSDQYEREERHRYSELAYKYDEGSKKSIFQPLPRPRWMRSDAYTEVKTQRISREHLPFGNIIDTTGYGKYGENAQKPDEKEGSG